MVAATLPLDQIPDDENLIREQIEVRRKLLPQMVGWLYPSILSDEIAKLQERLKEKRCQQNSSV